MTAISWTDVGLIWVYCIVWIFIEDWAKLAVYNRFRRSSPRHRGFLDILGTHVHPQARS
jgi:H+-transporting ATPase